jgi:alcohol dehydrogenase
MKGVQVGEPGTAKVSDVPDPKLQDPRDAVVAVKAAAICGADPRSGSASAIRSPTASS